MDPNLAGVYNNQGIAKSRLERHDEAIADFDLAISKNPNNPAYYTNRGIAKMLSGRSEEGRLDLLEALKLSKNDEQFRAKVEELLKRLENS